MLNKGWFRSESSGVIIGNMLPTGAVMIIRGLFLPIFITLVPILSVGADTTNLNGQYFCTVDHAAGIKVEEDKEMNERMYSGAVPIPEKDAKFFIKIGPYVHDSYDQQVCKEAMNYYLKEFSQKGIPYTGTSQLGFLHPSLIAQHCLASSKLQLTYTSDNLHPYTYWGYGDNPEYYGDLIENWFWLFEGGSFMRGFLYDNGPVIEHGHCTRIEPSK